MKDFQLGFCAQHSVHEINHMGASDKVLPSFQVYTLVQVLPRLSGITVQ